MAPLNIMVHGTKSRKVSSEEVAEQIARSNEQAAIREKHEYKDRARQIRKAAENMSLPDGVEARAVYDARTFFRHEQERPGCMADEGYLRELRRTNPEMRLD